MVKHLFGHLLCEVDHCVLDFLNPRSVIGFNNFTLPHIFDSEINLLIIPSYFPCYLLMWFLSPLSRFWCLGCRLPDWWDSWMPRRSPVQLISSNIPWPSLSPTHIQILFLQEILCMLSWWRFWFWLICFSFYPTMRGFAGPSLWWCFLPGVTLWSCPGLSLYL